MSLFGALRSSAHALDNFQRVIDTIQNNVTNASTPGFAKQRQLLSADRFDPENGISGGSSLAGRQNSRDLFAESGVRRQVALEGRFGQLASTLSQVEGMFDVTGKSGVPGALGKLFDSFSGLTVTPNDPAARQDVIDRASQLAITFNGESNSLRGAEAEARKAVPATVDHINSIAGLIREYNVRVRESLSAAHDPGLDAQVHGYLEQLAEYTDFNALKQADGSYTVLAGGQSPLVIGNTQLAIQADTSAAVVRILDSAGQDITSHITGGRLAGAVHATNVLFPQYLGDLHTLAKDVADAVNTTLAAGVDQNGQPGAALFTYNAAADAATTIAVTGLTTGQLAAARAGAPGGNGNALDLAALARSPQINGFSFGGFYANLAASVGRDTGDVKNHLDAHQQLLAQARELRSETQGVSLDEEATLLIQFQRSYQAAARMVTALDELTQATINMIR
jgi:flagellar hook-associated protein 1 FlgK